jgi:hypothetical protein
MQNANANYFGIMKCKIPKFLRLYLFQQKCIIYCPHWPLEVLLGFFLSLKALFGFFFLPIEAKIQNGKITIILLKFCMVFSSIMQNDKPKTRIFWMKGEKHPLKLSIESRGGPKLSLKIVLT